MRLKVGDKVKFLNERGGGVVSKILNSTMVNVAIEDGFEIPTRVSELIRMDDGSVPGGFFSESYQVELPANANEESEPGFENNIIPLIRFASKNQYPPGVYLAFIPQDQKWLMTGPIDIQIINYTGYDVLINFFLKNASGSYTGIDYDVIPADSRLFLETIQREEIETWCQGVIQLLFHRDQDSRVLMPVNSVFRIKPMKFYKDIHFQTSNLLPEKAFLYGLHELKGAAASESFPLEVQEKYDTPQSEPARAELLKPKELIDQHRIGPRIAEVDLHISSLIDDYSKLKNHEILTIQTRYFKGCLDSALEHHYFRIFFIHGVGNGTLKNSILELLKNFGGLEFHEAPFEHYGTGAIEVIIPDNL